MKAYLGLVCVVLLPGVAVAHGLIADVTVRDGVVTVFAHYDTGEPATQAEVALLNVRAEIVLQGTTDEAGFWTCAAPPAGPYRVRVDDDQGHRARTDFDVGDTDVTPAAPTLSRGARLAVGLGIIGLLMLLLRWFFTQRK